MSTTPTITFSGLASGLDSNAIITQLMAIERQPITKLNQQKSTLNNQQLQFNTFKTRINDLKSSIQKLTDGRLTASSDLFRKKSTASSDATVSDATASNSAVKGTYNLTVIALATSSRAQSLGDVGRVSTITSNVKDVNNGSVTTGVFSLFVNGTRHNITVDPNADTIADVMNRVQTFIPGSNVSVDASGKVSMDYGSGNTVSFGANGDTSNFANVFGLNNATTNTVMGTTTLTASKGTNEAKMSGALVGNAAGLATPVTAGTFTVGSKEITIDATTTLQGVLDKINSGGEVTATFDSVNNKLNLVSQKTGQQAITLGAGTDTSNFLSAVGLVSGGNSLASQTLGTNAQFNVNGTNYVSTSNSAIDASVHGQTGMTLSLKKVGTSTLTVNDNTDDLKTALKDVVTKMNDMLTFVRSQTGDGGQLRGENGVVRLRDTLRNGFSDVESGLTEYSILSQIGISTGAFAGNTTASQNVQFQFDETKFMAALQDNPDEVKKLLIGETAGSKGILGKALDKINESLDPEFGIFSAREKFVNQRIKTINDSVKRVEDRVAKKEKRLRAQFTAMEQTISRLRQQQSGLPQ